jgi:hypothetical protein
MYSTRKGVVADKIRSLGRIVRGSDGSSSQSTTVSEYPTPLGGRERRRQARDTYELHSQSVTSSPLFNFPTSEAAQSPIDTPGRIFDPLLRAGTLLATAELDRLSFLAQSATGLGLEPSVQESYQETSGRSSAVDVPPNTPATRLGASSRALPQVDGVLAPAAPANTPVSDISTPVTSGARHWSRRTRGAGSRLSQMSTSEEAPEGIERGTDFITTCTTQSSPGGLAEGTQMHRCERRPNCNNLGPKALVLTPSPTAPPAHEANDIESQGTLQLVEPAVEPIPEKTLDMGHLHKLLDDAIHNSIVTQRMNVLRPGSHWSTKADRVHGQLSDSSPPTQLKGQQHEESETARSSRLGSVDIKPSITGDAYSTTFQQAQPPRNLSALPVDNLTAREYAPRQVVSTASPAESRSAQDVSDASDTAGGHEPSGPGAMGDLRAHEGHIGFGLTGKHVRRRSSGMAHVAVSVECSDGSSGVGGSSDDEPPLADDGCPLEFARLKALREQLSGTTSGSMLRAKEST